MASDATVSFPPPNIDNEKPQAESKIEIDNKTDRRTSANDIPTSGEQEPLTTKSYNNGASVYRSAAIFASLCCLFFFLDTGTMFLLRGNAGDPVSNNNGTGSYIPISNDYSPTLGTFAVICFFVWILTVYDVYQTWIGTRRSDVKLTWDWQHANFKRMAVPIAVHGLLIFPTMMTFMNQSTGKEFLSLLQSVETDFQELLALHIVAFGMVILTGVASFVATRSAINYGKFAAPGKMGAEDTPNARLVFRMNCFDITIRVIAALNIFASLIYCASLIRGAALNGQANSGIIIFTTLYLIIALVMLYYQILLVFRRLNTKKWWLAFRAMSAAHLGIAYLVFWIWLILISLVGNPQDTRYRDGFWTMVNSLTPKRTALVYTHLILYLLYLIDSGVRVYYAKLRKEGRQPRVFAPVEAGKKRRWFGRGRKGSTNESSLAMEVKGTDLGTSSVQGPVKA